MCDPITCGTVLTIVIGGNALALTLATRGYNKTRKKMQLNHNLDLLTDNYSMMDHTNLQIYPDRDKILEMLGLNKGWTSRPVRRTMEKGQDARDRILFYNEPPTVKEAQRYLAAQHNLAKIDIRLLFVYDPKLLIERKSHHRLIMDTDITGCTDGTYRSSVDFAADYRNIVGEEYFHQRLEQFLQMNNLEGKKPWYLGRPDYEAKLHTSTTMDLF